MRQQATPKSLDLDREKGLTVCWQDGVESFYTRWRSSGGCPPRPTCASSATR